MARVSAIVQFFFHIKETEGDCDRPTCKMTEDVGSTTTSKPKALRVVKPRAAARPHRKLPGAVLKVRVDDTKKRLQILQSRAVLMEDRLATYEKEVDTRDE